MVEAMREGSRDFEGGLGALPLPPVHSDLEGGNHPTLAPEAVSHLDPNGPEAPIHLLLQGTGFVPTVHGTIQVRRLY